MAGSGVRYQVSLQGFGMQQGWVENGMIAGSRTVAINAFQVDTNDLSFRILTSEGLSDWQVGGAGLEWAQKPGGFATAPPILGVRVALTATASPGVDYWFRVGNPSSKKYGGDSGYNLASRMAIVDPPADPDDIDDYLITITFDIFEPLSFIQIFAMGPPEEHRASVHYSRFSSMHGVEPVPAVSALDRFNYLMDSLACWASAGAVAACVGTDLVVCAPLANFAAFGALISTCANSIEVGAKFVIAEAGLGAPEGAKVSCDNATLPGDIKSDGTVVPPPPGPPPEQQAEEQNQEQEEEEEDEEEEEEEEEEAEEAEDE